MLRTATQYMNHNNRPLSSEQTNQIPIVPSTGWLFADGKTEYAEQASIIDVCNGAELSATTPEKANTYDEVQLAGSQYISCHISPDTQLHTLRHSIKPLSPETVVFHPDSVTPSRIAELVDVTVPLSIENMDDDKQSGYAVSELQELFRRFPELGFTLDVEHAYRHDASMEYARRLVANFGQRLDELHVSGHTADIGHAPVSEADNGDAIESFLADHYSLGYETPIVMEGKYESQKEIVLEQNYLRQLVDENTTTQIDG